MHHQTIRGRLSAVLATGVIAAGALVAWTSPATAATGRTVCHTGDIASGTYGTLVIDGYCSIPDANTVVVDGNLVLKSGAILNAVTLATVHVHGDAIVRPGAILGLGCTVMGVGCSADSNQTVRGSILAYQPLTMFIDGVVVGGDVKSWGGGPGSAVTPDNLAFNFAFKDNTVHGRVLLRDWNGGWIGAIRNTVGRSLVYMHNAGTDRDANEIVANTVGNNLACWRNAPSAQFGDAILGGPPGYGPNTVGGNATGQCRSLTELPLPS
jgi:hypothetical protein